MGEIAEGISRVLDFLFKPGKRHGGDGARRAAGDAKAKSKGRGAVGKGGRKGGKGGGG